jgi:hypothetical protein
LVALPHWLGLVDGKLEVIRRHLEENKQRAFIGLYEKLLHSLGPDEVVVFAVAVHPTHAARGRWRFWRSRGAGVCCAGCGSLKNEIF